MSAELKDVMAYLIGHYPKSREDDLSNARLTKMVYLADWHQAINYDRQITGIEWYYNHYGPFVRDVEQTIEAHPDIFSVAESRNILGHLKFVYSLANKEYEPRLNDEEKESLDHIIKVTQDLEWAHFIRLVYATHPIFSSERYSALNLVEKAREYNRLQ